VFLGLHDLFSQLTYNVSLQNPASLGVLFIMGALSDLGFPLLLTLEIFVMFASYYIGPLSMQVLLIMTMLLLGREIGAAILYWVSRLVGTPFLQWLEKHFSWFLRGVETLKSRITQRITLAVVVVRLTPGFLQVPSIVAGSLHLQYWRFALGVVISSLIYDSGLVLFGFIARETIKNASQDLQNYFILGFMLVIIVMWLILFFRFRHIFDKRYKPD
jgi:membrane protein DedA with SNARE-associated domain